MSYPDWYRKISQPFREERATRAIVNIDRLTVAIIAIIYIGELAWLAFNGDARFWKALIVPALTFALVSGVRTLLNRPRPYELYDLDPLIAKRTKGKSFPSKHMASSMIIACALGWVSPLIGAVAFCLCATIAFTRIVGGVHFPRDIVAATGISLICGFVGFLMIPF